MSFETDIKPMFREEDRDAMDFIFDLWKYEDVRENAELIYQRIEDGSQSAVIDSIAGANVDISDVDPLAPRYQEWAERAAR